jgi:hypothetical protein
MNNSAARVVKRHNCPYNTSVDISTPLLYYLFRDEPRVQTLANEKAARLNRVAAVI